MHRRRAEEAGPPVQKESRRPSVTSWKKNRAASAISSRREKRKELDAIDKEYHDEVFVKLEPYQKRFERRRRQHEAVVGRLPNRFGKTTAQKTWKFWRHVSADCRSSTAFLRR